MFRLVFIFHFSWWVGWNSAELPAICSLAWAADGSYLGVGNENGDVEIWDTDAGVKMRTMIGHLVRIDSECMRRRGC